MPNPVTIPSSKNIILSAMPTLLSRCETRMMSFMTILSGFTPSYKEMAFMILDVNNNVKEELLSILFWRGRA